MSIEKEVMNAFYALLAAAANSDTLTLDKLVGKEYCFVGPDGELVNKEQLLSLVQQSPYCMSAELLNIQCYNNTAVIYGVAKSALFSARRFTSLWIKIENEWQTVAWHASTIK